MQHSFNYIYLTILILIISLSSCVSVQNLVEAESLGKGNKSIQLNSEFLIFPQGTNEPTGYWPTIGLQAGYGVTSNLDLRAELTSNRALRIQGKVQVLDQPKYDIALGGTADLDLLFQRAIHPALDLYTSYHFSNSTLLFNPSIGLTTNTYFTNGDIDGLIFSTTIGMKNHTFEKLKFGINLGYAPKSGFSPFLGIGLAYEIRQNKK